MRRRALLLVVAILGGILATGGVQAVQVAPAGAQTTIDNTWLTAYGSAHCVLTANHFMCERRDAWGNWNGHILDLWIPAWCQVAGIGSGNATGATMKIYFAAPGGYGVGCYPGVDNHPYWGWHTGTGRYEGQHATTGYTSRGVYYAGGNPASPSAWGTLIEVS